MSPVSDDDDFQKKDEDDVAIPRACLNKFIKDIIPDVRLTNETRELLLNCCHTFIHKLATEANTACTKANRKTISPQHILDALENMNLSAYKDRAESASNEAKEEIKGRRLLSASYRFKHQDSEEFERLMKEQQEMFQQARADFVNEQIDREDLLAASHYASTVHEAINPSSVLTSNHHPNHLNDNNNNNHKLILNNLEPSCTNAFEDDDDYD